MLLVSSGAFRSLQLTGSFTSLMDISNLWGVLLCVHVVFSVRVAYHIPEVDWTIGCGCFLPLSMLFTWTMMTETHLSVYLLKFCNILRCFFFRSFPWWKPLKICATSNNFIKTFVIFWIKSLCADAAFMIWHFKWTSPVQGESVCHLTANRLLAKCVPNMCQIVHQQLPSKSLH